MVVQEDKLRPCDDFTGSGVNAGTTTLRKLALPTVDHCCELVAATRAARAAAGLQPPAARAGAGCGREHCPQPVACPCGPPSGLLVWKRDQEAAYRQVPLCEEDRCFAVVVFWDPDAHRPVFYYHRVLPFGAVSSVYCYNRISFALAFLARKLFCIPLQVYFDDAWGIESAATAQSAFEAFGVLNTAFGFAIKFSKDWLPGPRVPILGVELDVEHALVLLCITDSRARKIGMLLQSVLHNSQLSSTQAASLAGKLGFACTSAFGRLGRAVIKPIRDRQYSPGESGLPMPLRRALAWFLRVMPSLPPRQVRVDGQRGRPMSVLYTDGAGDGCISAVLFKHARAEAPRFTAIKLPQRLLAALQPRKNQIGPIEGLAVVLALRTFGADVAGHDVILFIDNTDSQGVLGKGFGGKVDVSLIAGDVWERAARADISLFVARVRSNINIADGPSRPDEPGKMAELWALCGTFTPPALFTEDSIRALEMGAVVC